MIRSILTFTGQGNGKPTAGAPPKRPAVRIVSYSQFMSQGLPLSRSTGGYGGVSPPRWMDWGVR
jgi:hypothetical protein